MKTQWKWIRKSLWAAVLAGSFLCVAPSVRADDATGSAAAPAETRKALDILKPINVVFYWINDPIQRFIITPIATGYQYVIPRPVRHGINNFQNNILTPFKGLNNLLQGKGKRCGTEFGRFGINTTLGILGFMDIAKSKYDIQPHPEDFGQTLGVWGLHEGPFLYLPLLGPTTLRDVLFTFTMTRDGEEWYHGEKVGPIQYAAGWSLFMLNGRSLTYRAYDEGRKAAKAAGKSYYRVQRDNFVNMRYRATEDLDDPE